MDEPASPRRRALVLGGTGFIGSRLVSALASAGFDVAVYRRPGSDLGRLAGCRFTDIAGELDDAPALARALEGRGAVFNLAACLSLLARDRAERERLNVGFVRSLVGLCGPDRRLVHCSSAAAVGLSSAPAVLDEGSPFAAAGVHYAETKRAGEDLVREAAARGAVDAVVVNPATVVGPGMRPNQAEAFRRVLAGRMLFYPPGGTCLCYVEDVARGMMLALEKGRRGERYILGGSNLTFREYFRRVAALGGHAPPRVPLPRGLLPAAGALLEALTGRMGADAGRFAAGFGYYSSEKAARELDYSAAPLDEVLRVLQRSLRP